MHLLANEMIDKFKPTQYYITYDFETVERNINKYFGKKKDEKNDAGQQISNSFQNSILEPLSVATTIKSKSGIRTIYYDLRQGPSFIEKWLEEVFKAAEQIKQDNSYNDPEVPYEIPVPVVGFNSAHFDMIFVLPYLTNKDWHIVQGGYLGDFSHIKRVEVRHKISNVKIQFLDIGMFMTKMSLKEAAESFGDGNKQDLKGIFQYTEFNYDNFNEVLSKSEPFAQTDFLNLLKEQTLSDKDYQIYLEDSKNFKTRWEYLKYYNEQDTKIMIKPIDKLIQMNFNNGIDMFNYVSMASCANAIKYKIACDDFDLNARYENKSDTSLINYQTFNLTEQYWGIKVQNYKKQDIKAGRDVSNNVNQSDYVYFKQQLEKGSCWYCQARFTKTNLPTLDRIDNKLGHSKDNVRLACQYCNVARANRDDKIFRLKIQLKRYYQAKQLPMPLTDEDTYHELRNGITGGLANAFHRYNISGTTHINKLKLSENKVVSYDLEHIMTHITGFDFNSLYPSVYSGLQHEFIRYTGHQMYMPGYELLRINCVTEKQKQLGLNIIDNQLRFSLQKSDVDKVTMFVASVKGQIDEEYLNDFINCPPIIRKYKYKCLESVIGKLMYEHQLKNNLPKDRDECKLTVLLSTMGEYMDFYSYYLWFLIDDCHFIIDDIKNIKTFSKHLGFAPFVKHFSKQRLTAKLSKNAGLDQYSKIIMNSSYGSDGMNQEHFTDVKICDRDETFRAHLYGKFKSDRKLGDNNYAVEYEKEKFSCKTCIQVAFAVLDCSKYWFMSIYYNFLCKCIDQQRFHVVYCDTDSMMCAVSGDPNQDYRQGFSAIINEQKVYDENFYKFFPDPNKDIYDEKKLLGVAYEHCGTTMIALAPKNYWLDQPFDKKEPEVIKLKGLNLKLNPQINKEAYIQNFKEGTVVQGKNKSLRQHIEHNQQNEILSRMSRVETFKNGITGTHTKMICLANGCCCPYVYQLSADNYSVENL